MKPVRPALSPDNNQALIRSFGAEETETFLEAAWSFIVPEARPSYDLSYDKVNADGIGPALTVPDKLDDVISRMQLQYMQSRHIPQLYFAESGFTDVLRYIITTGRDVLNDADDMIPHPCEECYSHLSGDVRDGWKPVIQDIVSARDKDVSELTEAFSETNAHITFSIFRKEKDEHAHQIAQDDALEMMLKHDMISYSDKHNADYHGYWSELHNAMFGLCQASVELIRGRAAQINHQNRLNCA